MNAAEVIEAQADLLFRLTEHDPDRWRAQHNGEPPLMGYLHRLAAREVGAYGDARQLADGYVMCFPQARAYRVQENMTAAIVERARDYGSHTTVSGTRRPPRPMGFVRLDEPLRFRNIHGEAQAAHWIGWAEFHTRDGSTVGWILSMWNDVHTEPDETVRNLWRDAAHKRPYENLSRVDAEAGHREMFGRWAPITVGYVVADARLDDGDTSSYPDGDDEPSFTIRAIMALWELLGETVPARDRGDHIEHVESTDEHLPRTTARRARRDGLLDPAVTTVVLRRESRPVRHPGTGTPWDSRVFIEPYEAWRWVGPRHDRRKVRRKIAGHWSVGDESLPVRQRKIVSELRR